MEIINKFKEMLNSKKSNNLILIIVLLVILLISTNYIFSEDKNTKEVVSKNVEENENKDTLEEKLKNVIASINGVTDVNVMISFSETDKIIPVYDTKENTDTVKEENKTSTKTTTEKTVAYEDVGSSKSAIVESKKSATPTGAIVSIKGNISDDTYNEIKEAVSMVTNVPLYKIQLFVN